MSNQSIISQKAGITMLTVAGGLILSGGAMWAYKQCSRPKKPRFYSDPVVYQDFADCDVFAGPDGAFYYSASNMHYSPGAPIIRSYDLVNWEFVGHSIPRLSWEPKYDMADGKTAYVKGTWASTLRYRKSNGLWYWIGCIELDKTHIYTAPEVTGPWQLSSTLDSSYYDCGIFIDDDDTMYVVYGQRQIYLAQLSDDGLQEVKSEYIFEMPYKMNFFEGSRMYKRKGKYYVICDHPMDYEFVFKADNPWGPYSEPRLLVDKAPSSVPGGTTPNQGSLVELPNGEWEFVSFTSIYPLGRAPVIAKVEWDEEDFPRIVETEQPHYPLPISKHKKYDWMGNTNFTDKTLSPDWEWNHNPDVSKYSVGNGLVLHTATVTDDLFKAKNTVTHRMTGEYPTGIIEVDFSNMVDGDHCGLAAFRQNTSRIQITRVGDSYIVEAIRHATQQPSKLWETISKGEVTEVIPLSLDTEKKIWLKVSVDARPNGSLSGQTSYSFDGYEFYNIGKKFQLEKDWQYFMGYRFAIFNYAEKELGGSIKVDSFKQQ